MKKTANHSFIHEVISTLGRQEKMMKSRLKKKGIGLESFVFHEHNHHHFKAIMQLFWAHTI